MAPAAAVVARRDARRRGGFVRHERESEVSLYVHRARFLSPFPSHARARAPARGSVSLALVPVSRARGAVALSVSLARACSLARSLVHSPARPSVRRLARARAR